MTQPIYDTTRPFATPKHTTRIFYVYQCMLLLIDKLCKQLGLILIGIKIYISHKIRGLSCLHWISAFLNE